MAHRKAQRKAALRLNASIVMALFAILSPGKIFLSLPYYVLSPLLCFHPPSQPLLLLVPALDPVQARFAAQTPTSCLSTAGIRHIPPTFATRPRCTLVFRRPRHTFAYRPPQHRGSHPAPSSSVECEKNLPLCISNYHPTTEARRTLFIPAAPPGRNLLPRH